jgi:hypothetical protein
VWLTSVRFPSSLLFRPCRLASDADDTAANRCRRRPPYCSRRLGRRCLFPHARECVEGGIGAELEGWRYAVEGSIADYYVRLVLLLRFPLLLRPPPVSKEEKNK